MVFNFKFFLTSTHINIIFEVSRISVHRKADAALGVVSRAFPSFRNRKLLCGFDIRRAVWRLSGCFRLFVFFYSVRKICANIVGESPKFSSEFSSGRAVAPLRGRALPGLYAERTDYRLSTIDLLHLSNDLSQLQVLADRFRPS